ncbi:MAG: hypothetical protein V4581_03235 [Bacteroidota bacterium]
MNIKNCSVLIFCVLALNACGTAKSTNAPVVIEIEAIDIGKGVIMETDDDVNWRRYTFKDIPLEFVFTDSLVSRLSYGKDYHVRLQDLFYKPDMAKKNAETISRNYQWNMEYFMTDPVRSVITAAYRVSANGREYVICSFTKNQLGTLPYEDDVHYLIDITNKNSINAIAFPDVDDDGGSNDIAEDVFYGKDGLAIRFKYYSTLNPSTVSAGIITQDNKGNWVVE